MKLVISLVSTFALFVAGCAEMPNEVLTYNFPKAETNLVVTQTVGCNASNSNLVSAYSVTANTGYSSDFAQAPASIDFSQYGGNLSDADLSVSLTSDGRLSGINSTMAGTGGAVLKSAIAIAETAAATVVLAVAQDGKPTSSIREQTEGACSNLATDLGDEPTDKAGKLATLTYTVNLLYDSDASHFVIDDQNNPSGDKIECDHIILNPDLDSVNIYHDILPIGGKYVLHMKPLNEKNEAKRGPTWTTYSDWKGMDQKKAPYGYIPIQLNRTKLVMLEIDRQENTSDDMIMIWTGAVSVPILEHYPLLVPSGTLFGSQGFALSLTDDGSVTKLNYSTKSGASDVLDSGNALAGTLPTTSSEVSAMQTKADLIYEQQRLVTCKTSPTACTK